MMIKYKNPLGIRSYVLTLMICIALTIVSLVGCETKKEKIPKIGILIGTDGFMSAADGFMANMKTLGYEDSVNVSYDLQNASTDPEKMKEIVRKFVSEKVDLIVTAPHGATIIAKEIAKDTGIPVIFAVAMANKRIIESIAKPGGNITGVRSPLDDFGLKTFESLIEIKPQIKRILFVYQKDYPPAVFVLSELRTFIPSRGVTLVEVPLENLEAMIKYFDTHSQADINVDAIQTLPEPLCHSIEGWNLLKTFAKKNQIPIGGSAEHIIKDGAILALHPSNYEMGELTAPLVVKVLTGTQAGTIPLSTPKLHLRVNQKVAIEMGLTIPDHLMKQAVEIIQ